MEKTLRLSSTSEAYYSQNLAYEKFAEAEDSLGVIEKYMKPEITNKVVLDVGCGTGRWLRLFDKYAKEIIGLDLSPNQLEFAKNKTKAKLICADASNMPLEDNYFDIIYATWALSTIKDLTLTTQGKVLDEMERVLKPGGKIILVENDKHSEFRDLFYANRTKEDKEWINKYQEFYLKKGFSVQEQAETYFKFKDIDEARAVMAPFFGKETADNNINSNKIKHSIIIFERKKNDFQKQFDNGETIVFDKPTLILASASPRRAKHLQDAGIEFIKIISSVDDSQINYDHPHSGVSRRQWRKYVKQMALAKLGPFIGKIQNGAVVTADTTVYCKGHIIEKPITPEKCREQHEFLSGKTNYVYTAVAVHFNGKTVCRLMASKVKIKKLPNHLIDEICCEKETLDAAGYRSAGAIAPYVIIKSNAHRKNVQGLDPKCVSKILRKLGFNK